jgi:nucleoside-diphosphate-sugar epimerase
MTRRILILGCNGFIGHHLLQHILATTDWHIAGLDVRDDRITGHLSNPRLTFLKASMMESHAWISEQLKTCDTMLPLVAIATPSTYVNDPLRVFELDFEANLAVVRLCVTANKRVIFPSTSEVYGMCTDAQFDPETSNFIQGPINKPRWIYSTSKQLLDRVIHAYGMAGLDYTLFRPFNWIGAGLDTIENPAPGSARVISQFLGHIWRGENISLVNGGEQKRAFMYVDDAIVALTAIIANPNNIATRKIYNIGNPQANHSIRTLAEKMLALAAHYPVFAEGAKKTKIEVVSSDAYYGKGYQDVQHRVPNIDATVRELHWSPKIDLDGALTRVFDAYAAQLAR